MIPAILKEKWITPEDLELRDQLLSWTTDKKLQYKSSCYEVMVHKLCQEKCFFCSQDHASRTTDIKPDDLDIYKRILYGAKKWYGMLWFTWGEPLIHKHILKYIQFWKKAWFRLIRVQTNGVMLWNEWFADKCVDAGATLFKFSIHHYKPEIHDYLVQLPWAFAKVEAGIKRLRELWARIGINIVLTAQNYKDLPDFLMYFLDKGVTTFVIIFPLYENSMKDEASVVWFRFADTIPYIIKSLHIFDTLNIKRPLLLNLPMCLLPWYESAIIQTFNGTAVLNLDGSKTNIDDNKAGWKKRVKICTDCEHNKICFWVDEKYINQWGEDEFHERSPKIEYQFDLDALKMKNYFTEDELCFMEILRLQERVTVEDIVRLKEWIQICQDCDSINKIISTGDILAQKSLIRKKFTQWKVVYERLPPGGA
jgi:MoaA/NifB/PqqE/SkfB family radical SAM enzyme